MPSYIDQTQEVYSNELYHHGVKGQKWGIRRYQNYDGTRINKAPIGSATRVRQKQSVIKNKIKNSNDDNIIVRNTINDYRRGRVAALETKAKHREARDAYKQNRTAENKAALRKARGERVVRNVILGGGEPISMTNLYRGTYNRYRANGNSQVKAALKTVGKYNYPQIAAGAALVGAYKD